MSPKIWRGLHRAMITPSTWGDIQGDAIDASEGENLMLVTTITSMSHGVATIWARWAPRLIAMIKVHPDVAGFAIASASWSTGPRDVCRG
jgi:hypothetical protein